MKQKLLIAPLLILSLFLQACGAVAFAKKLSDILDVSDPFVQSLPFPQAWKDGALVDFKDLARGAATLASDIDACAKDNLCKVTAVEKLRSLFETVYNRGHLGADNERLRKVVGYLKAIIASARLYYGGAFSGPGVGQSAPVTEADLKRLVEELKRALKP